MKSVESRKRKSGLSQGRNAADLITYEQELHERVAQKAYDLYEKRGRTDGCDVEDWLEAERLVVERLENHSSLNKEPRKRSRVKAG